MGLAEKRSSVRVKVRWRLLILLPDGDKKTGYVLDVSEGGARLSSLFGFSAGSRFRVAIFVPDAQKYGAFLVTLIDCKVAYEVLREAEVQMGVEFLSPSEEVLRRIRMAIAPKQVSL